MVKFTAFICQLLKKPTSYSYIAYTQSSGSVPQKKKFLKKNPVEVTLLLHVQNLPLKVPKKTINQSLMIVLTINQALMSFLIITLYTCLRID
jgi:hypothetical protein